MEGLVKCGCGCGGFISKSEYDYMNKKNVMHTSTAVAIIRDSMKKQPTKNRRNNDNCSRL